jgi:O-antigen/teichoic acid export membrane protein
MSIFNKKKAIDFSVYGFGQLVSLLSPFIVIPFLIRICGEEGLGKIGAGFSIALILCSIVDYGSYIIGVREISINRQNPDLLNDKVNSIYGSKLLLLILLALILGFLIKLIPFFNQEKELIFFSFMIVVGQSVNPMWFLQGVENFKWISFINIFSKLIYVLGVYGFVSNKLDYIYVNLIYGMGLFIASSIGLIWIINRYSFTLTFRGLWSGVIIIRQEFWFSLSQLLMSFHQYIPILIVRYLLGDFAAGQFKVVDQIISLFKTFFNITFYFVYSNICDEIEKNYKYGIKVWKQYNLLSFVVVALGVIGCVLFSEIIVSFFNVNQNSVSQLAEILRWGVIIGLLMAFSQPLKQLIFALGKNKVYEIMTIFITILNVILMSYFTQEHQLFGTIGAMIAIECLILISFALILKTHKQS